MPAFQENRQCALLLVVGVLLPNLLANADDMPTGLLAGLPQKMPLSRHICKTMALPTVDG